MSFPSVVLLLVVAAPGVCPTGLAWSDIATAENQAHAPAECSNRGICNTASGECDCFSGFTGDACQRTVCRDECSGHGRCMNNKQLAQKTDALPLVNSTYLYTGKEVSKAPRNPRRFTPVTPRRLFFDWPYVTPTTRPLHPRYCRPPSRGTKKRSTAACATRPGPWGWARASGKSPSGSATTAPSVSTPPTLPPLPFLRSPVGLTCGPHPVTPGPNVPFAAGWRRVCRRAVPDGRRSADFNGRNGLLERDVGGRVRGGAAGQSMPGRLQQPRAVRLQRGHLHLLQGLSRPGLRNVRRQLGQLKNEAFAGGRRAMDAGAGVPEWDQLKRSRTRPSSDYWQQRYSSAPAAPFWRAYWTQGRTHEDLGLN